MSSASQVEVEALLKDLHTCSSNRLSSVFGFLEQIQQGLASRKLVREYNEKVSFGCLREVIG